MPLRTSPMAASEVADAVNGKVSDSGPIYLLWTAVKCLQGLHGVLKAVIPTSKIAIPLLGEDEWPRLSCSSCFGVRTSSGLHALTRGFTVSETTALTDEADFGFGFHLILYVLGHSLLCGIGLL